MITLPETNSLHMKMDGWNTSFLLGWPIFRCYVSVRECNQYESPFLLNRSSFDKPFFPGKPSFQGVWRVSCKVIVFRVLTKNFPHDPLIGQSIMATPFYESGDSWMYPYQLTPMGNPWKSLNKPYSSWVFMGKLSLRMAYFQGIFVSFREGISNFPNHWG